MPASGDKPVLSGRRSGVTLALASLLLLGAVCLALLGGGGAPARAATYGQIGEPWGTVGTGPGQLNEPGMFGVDPVDGSVYVGDARPGSPSPGYRLQKFSSSGAFEASVELPANLNVAEKKERLTFRGAAVDHAAGLVYLLEQCGVGTAQPPKCKETGAGTPFALALRAYKITPSGSELVPAATPRILLPTSVGDQIRKPTSIAVDPASHGVVIFGSSVSEHFLIERIGPTGTVEARFEDSERKLQPFGSAAGPDSVVVGPTGIVYTLVGSATLSGAKRTRLWELPQDLGSLGEVPGFAEAAEAEGWVNGAITNGSLGVPELALSLDGRSIYWKEGSSSEVLVRDFSLATNSSLTVFGGGTGRCQINSTAAGLGVWGEGLAERLLVLDPGVVKPRNQVITFGQGGDGCPVPVAKFKINGTEADGTVVQAGQPVEFDASSSELLGGEPEKVTWSFGDGSVQAVVECERLEAGGECERPASLKATHEYETNGEYTVTLAITLTHSAFGNPAPAEHTLKVEGGTPPPPKEITVQKAGTGTGDVTSSPAGISCGSECSAPFEAGQTVVLTAVPDAGSEFAGWSGGSCSGEGTCTLTGGTEQTVTAKFEAEGPPPSEFELSVSTSGSGTVTSSPAGISCGSTCAGRYAAGATVTLTATPAAGATFSGWSGACGGAGSCEVEMSETRSVRATFAAAPVGRTLVVALAGNGTGAVKSEKPGINCGTLCEGSYKTNTVVALFPEAMPGSEFVSWGGSCLGAGLVCELKMSGERSVSAVFALKPVVTPTPISTPAATPAAAAPAQTPQKPKAKKSSQSKALKRKLARCKKLKGKLRAKCVRRARSASQKKPTS